MFDSTVSNSEVAVDGNEEWYKYPKYKEKEKVVRVPLDSTTVAFLAIRVHVPSWSFHDSEAKLAWKMKIGFKIWSNDKKYASGFTQ